MILKVYISSYNSSNLFLWVILMIEWIVALIVLWIMTFFVYKSERPLWHGGFAFFDGILLSMLCFWLLPKIFSHECFWLVAISLLLGVFLGAVCENRSKLISSLGINKQFISSMAVSIGLLCYCFFGDIRSNNNSYFSMGVSFFGGLFLLIACGGILPEEDGDTRIFSVVGGLVGFLFGVFRIIFYQPIG